MSKRLLILDNSSNCLDMAIRAKLCGWTVAWYDKPRPDGSPRLAGIGMFQKIQDFNEIKRKWLDWCDICYMPDNVAWVDFLEPYRLKGYPILAASPAAAKLELDRQAGQLSMKKAGMRIMESKEFNDYDAAIAFVKKNPQFLVSKPSGDANKALSYVAHDPADLVYMLQRWKNNPQLKTAAKKEGFILQERKYGVEMAVGGFFGPHGFGQYFYENWEYKKLMADDLGVNTGEMGCYDDKTEVLTENGWKFWPDVTMEDKLATLVNGVTVFELPSVVVKYDYDGDMVCWNNQTLDIMVTPNHNMYVNKQSSARKKKDENYEFILAENCTDSQYEIQGTSETRSWLDKRDRSLVHYSGKVYCATVSSHILYVRRNGKPLWCGNTLSRMVKRSKLADIVLKPIEEQLHKLGYVGYVDNNCIIDDKGIPWPMEYTMRDGWPTKHNVTAHVKNEDTVQWMLDMVNGRDTMECIDGEVCVSALIALPDFPYSKITNKELCGIPIRGADDMEHIHLSEAMMGIAPTMVGDKVVDQPGLVTCGDYVMVVTGTGDTITAARKDCYTAVKKVKIPNNMMYRPDIGSGRMKKHLPILHRLGFAKGMEFA